MSEQREALAAVLAAHEEEANGWHCSCQDATLDVTWEDHLADVILREWLPGALADERVVEAAAKLLLEADALTPNHDGTPEHYVVEAENVNYLTTTALTAAVTALTEDDA